MSTALAQLQQRFAHTLPHPPTRTAEEPARWSLEALAGRLVELSGTAGATLTPALALAWQAQRAGEPVAWVTLGAQGVFHPPDAAANGLDLAALAVVTVPDARDAARAADRLARSGAFGLIVLDLGKHAAIPAALQGRLMQQAQRHDTAIVCLTDKPARAPSLGSLVSLRGQVERRHEAPGRFACTLEAVKDKRAGPGWQHAEVCHGPPGLR